jgi:hypothetical protein
MMRGNARRLIAMIRPPHRFEYNVGKQLELHGRWWNDEAGADWMSG